MNPKQKNSVDVVLLIIAAVLSVITIVLGATQKAVTLNTNFSLPLIASLAGGVVLTVIYVFSRVDFLSLFASVCFSAGFGMIINEGLAVVVDKINDISFQGGNFQQVAAYMGMMLTACLLGIIACFKGKKS